MKYAYSKPYPNESFMPILMILGEIHSGTPWLDDNGIECPDAPESGK
jgi:hypothetical protein